MINNGNRRANRRVNRRRRCEVPVLLLGGKPLQFYHASMLNFSEVGFYFETFDPPLEAGALILVRADDNSGTDPVSSGTWKPRQAEVKWCMEKEVNGWSRRYGCGAQYV